MKNILVSLLLITSLCSFAKKKEKPEPAIAKGSFTAIAATGYPNLFRYSPWSSGGSIGPLIAAGEYQVSRRFNVGLQYSYHHSSTGTQTGNIYTRSGSTISVVSTYQYERKLTFHLFMATADYCYLNKGRVLLSSGIGLGWSARPTVKDYFSDNINHSNDLNAAFTNWVPAVHLRVADVKVRIKDNFGLNAGIGLGTDGLIFAGAHYTFTGRK